MNHDDERNNTMLEIRIETINNGDINRIIERVRQMLDTETARFTIDIRSKIVGGQMNNNPSSSHRNRDEGSEDNPGHRSRHRDRADK